MMSVEKEKD